MPATDACRCNPPTLQQFKVGRGCTTCADLAVVPADPGSTNQCYVPGSLWRWYHFQSTYLFSVTFFFLSWYHSDSSGRPAITTGYQWLYRILSPCPHSKPVASGALAAQRKHPCRQKESAVKCFWLLLVIKGCLVFLTSAWHSERDKPFWKQPDMTSRHQRRNELHPYRMCTRERGMNIGCWILVPCRPRGRC
jgi:hypothetical protein